MKLLLAISPLKFAMDFLLKTNFILESEVTKLSVCFIKNIVREVSAKYNSSMMLLSRYS
jgi:hypothetical protein